jgi:hypothetical protein
LNRYANKLETDKNQVQPKLGQMTKLSKIQISQIRRQIEVVTGKSIVLIDVACCRDIPLDEHNQNIYCIDQDMNIIWQIHAGSTTYSEDSFVYLGKDDTGRIRADRFFGNEFIIDPDTGIAELKGWHK